MNFLFGRLLRTLQDRPPAEEGTAFVPDRERAWRDILCVVEERVVGSANTVAPGSQPSAAAGEPPASALCEGKGGHALAQSIHPSHPS
jgi:hypothetical protein